MKKPYSGLKSSVNKPRGKSKAKDPYAKAKKYKGMESTAAKKNAKPKPKPKVKSRRIRILPLTGGHLVEQLPDTALSVRGLTLKQLYRNTPKMMRMNGEETTVKKLKRTKTKSLRPAVTAVCRHNDPYRPDATPRDHKTQIVGRDPDLKLSDRKQKVLVSCDCENFVYVWEYANAEHGASKIVYGNGEKPDFTNPSHSPGLCKHLSALAAKVIAGGY